MEKPSIKILKNGFTLVYVPHRGVKSVTLQLRGFAGSNFEKKSEKGIAHIVEHISLEISEKNPLLLKGAKIIGVTSREDVLFMVKILGRDANSAVDFLQKVFTVEKFDSKLLESLKGVAEEENKRFMNVPEKLIGRLSYKILFPEQRMSEFNTGSLEDIQEISLPNVVAFKRRVYRPENFILTVSGDLNTRQLLDYASRIFVKVGKEDKKIKKAVMSKLPRDKSFRIQNFTSKYFSQAHVRVDYHGYLLSDSDRLVAAVLAELLESYLINEIKTKRGFAYTTSCESYSACRYGIFGYYFASDNKHLENVLKILFTIGKNINKIASQNNVLTAKNQIISSMEFAFEKTSFRAEYYSNNVLKGLSKQTFSGELNRIKSVSTKDLLRVFTNLHKQNPKISILTDRPVEGKVQDLYKESKKNCLQNIS